MTVLALGNWNRMYKCDGELLSKIDAAIAKLNANGTMQQIIAKWGLD